MKKLFRCSLCEMRIEIVKENIEIIENHLNPPERFYKILNSDLWFSIYEESIKININFLKYSDVAEIMFESYFRCKFCHFICSANLDNCESLIIHSQLCSYYREASDLVIHCIFCGIILANSIWDHYNHEITKCSKIKYFIHQIMSISCKSNISNIIEKCLLCHEFSWPYLGQSENINSPLCETCWQKIVRIAHFNESTLTIPHSCSICLRNCSKKYYKFQNIIMGLKCINEIRNPRKDLLLKSCNTYLNSNYKIRAILKYFLYDNAILKGNTISINDILKNTLIDEIKNMMKLYTSFMNSITKLHKPTSFNRLDMYINICQNVLFSHDSIYNLTPELTLQNELTQSNITIPIIEENQLYLKKNIPMRWKIRIKDNVFSTFTKENINEPYIKNNVPIHTYKTFMWIPKIKRNQFPMHTHVQNI